MVLLDSRAAVAMRKRNVVANAGRRIVLVAPDFSQELFLRDNTLSVLQHEQGLKIPELPSQFPASKGFWGNRTSPLALAQPFARDLYLSSDEAATPNRIGHGAGINAGVDDAHTFAH
jgi:hypothetical protein